MSLIIDHVRRSFGQVQAVRDVWISAPEGSVMGVIGPNGAGKTTTMRMILNIIPPESGTVTWLGKSTSAWPLGTFGYLPEERGLYPQMRGRDELRFFAQLHGVSAKQADKEIEQWAELLSIDDILFKKVEELSKGNAQKLQFLAAVLHRPKMVILDEPFSGLDPVNTRLFKDAVKRLHAMGSTILFSSHQMDYVEELCDRVCLIADGKTLIHGSIAEVRQASGSRVLTVRAGAANQNTEPNGLSESLFSAVPGVRLLDSANGQQRYELSYSVDSDQLLRMLMNEGPVQHFSVDYPSLEDVYIASVTHVGNQTEQPALVGKGVGA